MTQSAEQLEALELDSIATTAWQLLQDAATDLNSAFRTPVLSTLDKNTADSRTVVLRYADPHSRTLECYTDARSAKIEQLRLNSGACWVFYDPLKQLQLRARGTCQVHVDDQLTAQRWALMAEHNRCAYSQVIQPGRRVLSIEGAAPCTEAIDSDQGQKNFAVVSSTIEQIEWLLLSRNGHQRAIAVPHENHWSSYWVMP